MVFVVVLAPSAPHSFLIPPAVGCCRAWALSGDGLLPCFGLPSGGMMLLTTQCKSWLHGPSDVYGSPTPESVLGRPRMPELSMLFSCCPFRGSRMCPCICRGKVGWEETGFLPFSSPLPPVLPSSAFNHYRDQENE